jgi:hypothetical protein
MLYLVPSKGTSLGLMDLSWDSFQTSSMEDDDPKVQGLNPKKKEDSFEPYNSIDEDWIDVYISKAIYVP